MADEDLNLDLQEKGLLEGDRDNPFAKNQSKSSKPSGTVASASNSDGQMTNDQFREALESIFQPNTDYKDKVGQLSKLIAQVIPTLYSEANRTIPNPDRSTASARTVNALKSLLDVIQKANEHDDDDLNVKSPKFTLVLSWFLELFMKAMYDSELDEITVNTVFNKLAGTLPAWEDTLEKSLKGVKGKAINTLQNPFIAEVVQRARKAPEQMVESFKSVEEPDPKQLEN